MNILGLGEVDVDDVISEYLKGQTVTGGGYISEEYYKIHSESMKENNPMHRPEVVAKRSKTMTGKPGRKLYDWEKKALSERMKQNNPMKNNPGNCATAKPVTVYWTDGTSDEFEYLKQVSEQKEIPYSTLQWCLYNNKPSKKNKIQRIEQHERRTDIA